MKTIEHNHEQLTKLKPEFLRWLRESWCECATNEHCQNDSEYCSGTNDDKCCCYGRDEYDEVWKFIVDDESARIYYAHEADPTADHQRQLIMVRDETWPGGFAEAYIKSGDLEWNGDDVDYMGPVLFWLIEHSTKED